MTSIASCRSFFAFALFALFSLSGGAARAADQCAVDGQILLPSGACMAGYYGYSVSNCQAVGNNALVVEVPSGHLTCVAGPSCPDGYQQGLPPPQNATPGFPNPMPPGYGPYEVSNSMCNAVCAPVFVQNHWPCSCPYGEKLDTSTGSCAPVCGAGATWQHTPGYDSQAINGSYLVADPGMCTCPSGQEYDTAQGACMTPCPQGQIHDGAGKCYAPSSSGGSVNVCKSGQHVGGCQCPMGGIVKNGICIICAISGPNGVGTPDQDPACKNADGSGNNDGDEMGPHNPGLPAKCLPGSHWNGLKCVANKPATPSCPAGSHWNGSACVANSSDGDGYRPVLPMQPAKCPVGTHWNGLKCIANQPALPPACAAGSRWNGSACVPVRMIPMCPRGTRWDGRRCAVPRIVPTPECASDQHWDGRVCVANGCSAREHWDGRQCVAN